MGRTNASNNRFHTVSNLVTVARDTILIGMYLCKDYARSQTTKTDSTRNINEKVPFISSRVARIQ